MAEEKTTPGGLDHDLAGSLVLRRTSVELKTGLGGGLLEGLGCDQAGTGFFCRAAGVSGDLCFMRLPVLVVPVLINAHYSCFYIFNFKVSFLGLFF